MALKINKWEVKSHSYQIGDTGDYDGWHELTNDVISLGTKEDNDDTVAALNDIAHALNEYQIVFFDTKADDLSVDKHCLEDEIKIKEQEWKVKYDELKAENEALQTDFKSRGLLINNWKRSHEALEQQHQQLKSVCDKMAIAIEIALAPRNLSSQGHISTAAMEWLAVALSECNQSKGGKE